MTQQQRSPLSLELDRHLTKAGMEGIDLTQIAAAAGISQGYLSHLRRGTRPTASRHVLVAIAEVLGLGETDTANLLKAGGYSETEVEASSALRRFRSRNNTAQKVGSATVSSDTQVHEHTWKSDDFGVEAHATFRATSPGKLAVKVGLKTRASKTRGQESPKCTVSLITDGIERSRHDLTPAWPVVLPDVPEGHNELRWVLSIGDRIEQFVFTHRSGASLPGS